MADQSNLQAVADAQPNEASSRIIHSTDNSIALQISQLVKQGAPFQQILDTYTSKIDLDPQKVAEIHEYKSRIQEALRIGTPIEEVINSIFPEPEIRSEIMNGINQYKAAHAQATAKGSSSQS